MDRMDGMDRVTRHRQHHHRALMSPEGPYEREGYRGHVLFPGGTILEDDGEVKMYYGAADTVECLATAHVDDLVALCTEQKVK